MNPSSISRLHRPTPKLLACALASCLVVMAPNVFSQSTAATLRGQVSTDASVTATNLATGLTRTVQANAAGEYVLAGLPPGTYRIDVTAGGATTTRNVNLQVGESATLDVAPGGLAETAPTGPVTQLGTVLVTAPRLVEAKTSEVATYVSPKQIEALPQGSRNFLAFADIVPGMIFSTGDDGSTKLRSGAQSSNGINVFIDGVGQKNYVLKGGITGQDSSRGNPFPQMAIGEYKVITSNYKAEFDQLSSAAVTAVTRTGTNEFEGNVFMDHTSEAWRAPTVREDASGMKTPSKEEQYGISFGGPIIQDRMHFFLTYEAKEFNSPREVRIGEGYTLAELPAELQPLVLATTSAPFKEDLYFGKIDWTPGDAHLFELSAKHRSEDELTNIGNGINTAAFGTTKEGKDTRIDLRYQYNAQYWLNDVHLTYEDASFGPRPIFIGPGYRLTTPDRRGILNAGGGENFQDKGQKGTALQDDFTWFGWEGHTIKAGVKFKAIEVNAFEQLPFNPQFFYDIEESSTVPYRVEFGARIPGAGDRNITSNNRQFGIYLQDDWEVNDHLTLNLGVRWDYEETPAYEDYVTPANLVAALRGWTNIQNTDYDIENYISTGNERDSFTGAWQPRLGFSYDINGDERHVVFGGAGRSYDRNLFDYLALEQSKSTFPRYNFDFNTPDHPCTVGVNNCLAFDPRYFDQDELEALVAANPNLGAEVNLMNNDLDTPYSDQFSLGMRNTVPIGGHDWDTSATLVHIRSHDGLIFSLGNRYPDGSFYGAGRTFGGAPFGQPIPGFGTLIKVDNGVETRMNQLLLSAGKPYTSGSPWGVTLAYTFTDSEENRSNAANSDEHYVFDYPNLDDHPWVSSIGISKHRFVGTGIVDFWGLTFSTKLTWASPIAHNVLNCLAPTDPGQDGCANGTFEAGYFDDADFMQWDIAVQKEWDTGTDIRMRVRADVLNVTNERNWNNFNTFKGINGVQNPTFGEHGDGISLPTRTFKLTVGFSW